MGPVEISKPPNSRGQNPDFVTLFLAISADFKVLLVEISEVLPVEISTIRSGLSSTFTGKNNYLIRTHRSRAPEKTARPPLTAGFGARPFKCVQIDKQ